jgi:uncharacterized protein (UPF0332 family)
VTPQAAEFLAKARHLLAEADIMFGAGLNDAAGRTAYLAGFHAAQAFIFEREGKMFKTHRGVQREFLRLTKDDPRMDRETRSFLSRSYNLKSIADYETGPGSEVSAERAAAAVEGGNRFVAHISALLSEPC